MKITEDPIKAFNVFKRCAMVAALAHSHQTRKRDGAAYIEHPLTVSVLLLEGADECLVTNCAAVLHDVIEDCEEKELERVKEEILKLYPETRFSSADAIAEYNAGFEDEEDLYHGEVDYYDILWYEILRWATYGDQNLVREIDSTVQELTVEFPHMKYGEPGYWENKQLEIDAISRMSREAAAVKGADKKHNSVNPIEGRDWKESMERYYKPAWEAVKARLARDD